MVKVLSLFDGISCGAVAFERAGITVAEYHACEIDKHAIKVSEKNYPQIVRHGSVTDYHPDRHFDYIIGGSPCQGFSFAGKQLAFDDPRSALFFEFVRILKECRAINPNIKFLLENVKMKKEHLDVISEQLGAEPVCINSALVSAQNRVRYYWANWEFGQPQDKGVVLRDILVTDPPECQFIGDASKPQRVGIIKNGGIGNRIYSTSAKSISLCRRSGGTAGTGNLLIEDGDGYRKLTTVECERLQTLPDGYTGCVSYAKAHQHLGNGWTVDVIAHILRSS